MSQAEDLLTRCGQGADKSEVFGCEKLEQVMTSFRQVIVNVNLW